MPDVRIGTRGSVGEFVEQLLVEQPDGTNALVVLLGGTSPAGGGIIDVTDRIGRLLGIATIRASYDGVNLEIPRLDASTFALNTVDYAHHEIHAGSAYECSYVDVPTDVDARVAVSFLTPATTKFLHPVVSASVSGPALFQFLEAPTITDNLGSPLPVYNRNRNSLNTSGVLDTSQNPDVAGQATSWTMADVAAITGGTALVSAYLASGARNFAAGGTARGVAERVLKPDTLYAAVLTSKTNDDNYATLDLSWYEHTDRVA